MNKKIKNIVSKYDFEIKRNTCYGYIGGYEVNVCKAFKNEFGYLFAFSTFLEDSKKNEIIEKMQTNDKRILMTVNEFRIIVSVGPVSLLNYEEKMDQVINELVNLLNEYEAPKSNVCPKTGIIMDETNSKYVHLKHEKFKLSYDAIEIFNEEIDTINKNISEAPNNYFKGILGLLIGGLVGGILSAIGYRFGFVGSLASLVSIYLGIYLYKKFGGKPNALMIILSYIITFVFVILALFIVYVLVANQLMQNTQYSLLNAFGYCYKTDNEFTKAFNSSLAFTIGFYVLSCCWMAYFLIKSIKRPKKY